MCRWSQGSTLRTGSRAREEKRAAQPPNSCSTVSATHRNRKTARQMVFEQLSRACPPFAKASTFQSVACSAPKVQIKWEGVRSFFGSGTLNGCAACVPAVDWQISFELCVDYQRLTQGKFALWEINFELALWNLRKRNSHTFDGKDQRPTGRHPDGDPP